MKRKLFTNSEKVVGNIFFNTGIIVKDNMYVCPFGECRVYVSLKVMIDWKFSKKKTKGEKKNFLQIVKK